ncbi:autotransporter outer membrane beta-barrel domain-containing protein [Pseudomonas syringae]|uniref:autotransporter outer membrane beta-barrel domain-containing protein n=1 Tax=Pseudomonas syringae TaxID=317 RepID=UPI001E4A36E2|nr:autotransporter outer membrane beta-barrel domain-containing protein [Pseudomonas syringae]
MGLSVGLALKDHPNPSVVNLGNSSITAANIGVLTGTLAVISLSNSTVIAAGGNDPSFLGVGATVVGGELNVSQGSYIEGANQAIRMFETTPTAYKEANKLVIDSSIVRGLNGSAIFVETTARVDTDIQIRNGANLMSSNNTLLEVDGSGLTNFTVDNSNLTGNLIADDTTNLDITLQNNAQLTGNMVNSKQLAINSGAQWTLVEDAQINSLSLDGGRLSFGDAGDGAFKTLNLNALSGNGTFDMRINLDEREGDLLKVNGTANGDHQLRVKNTGVEVVAPDMQPYLLVDTNGGDARFSLAGARADLGVYSYELEQQGDDWFIVGSGKIISPSTQSVLALFNAAPNIWNSELSTLRSRMGEVRGKEQAGGWIRAYGSRFNASTSEGVDYRNNQSGLSLGADAPLPVSVGQLSVGLMTGYSKNDLDIGRGTSGKVGSYYVGGYGTWLLDDGYYLDGVLKLNRFRNESKVAMSDGARAKGNYESTGIGGSLEFGRHIKFADGYFLEPFTQLSSVWVRGDSYTLDNGMRADNNRTQSVLGKVGASAGRSIALKDGGVLQPYLRVAAAHEFSRNNQVEVNKTRFDNQLSGSRGEVGAGVSVSLSERLQLHADFDYMKGKGVEQPWGANVGLKLAF